MKDQQKEHLFRAIGDVGADLIDMAEKRTFAPSRWRKWGSLAACLAVIVCLAALALPYFPMGCGSSAPSNEASTASVTNASQWTADEAPAEAEPEAGEAAVEERAENSKVQEAAARTRLVFRYTYYYLSKDDPVPPDAPPSELGELLGEVEECEDETLVGCPVYRYLNTTEFDNHSVNGLTVPEEIWVETPEGYRYAITLNEKTVSRFTLDDVAEHLEADDRQWIVDTFVEELWEMDDFSDPSELTGEQLNRFLWYTSNMNTGLSPASLWREEDGENGRYVIPVDEAVWRLDRFLDVYTYTPEETSAYDAARNALVFGGIPLSDALPVLRLETLEMPGGNTLRLRVSEYENDVDLDAGDEPVPLSTREFLIRFDEDSWRYLSIQTTGPVG